jgi:enamine deaminase RidA (YjgF/YER057c/UK114 family)
MTDDPTREPVAHEPINPDGLLPPVGFSHAVVAAPGRTVHLGGQTGHHADGSLDEGLFAQFGQALRNLVTVLAAAGAAVEHVVSMQLYVTDVAAYRAAPAELGRIYREAFGRHYPAMALFGVTGLHDPAAVVEIVATAVIPEAG